MYNAAAWINRRERHLAVNAVLYCLGVAWETRLVAHHLDACRGEETTAKPVLTLVQPEAHPSCDCDLKVA